ncbi:MAG TPA: hypothetical protein VMZ50_10025 [Phycisphaerae bacterium]|nr:hypothetical protein [Phycisphaerae bacterium]
MSDKCEHIQSACSHAFQEISSHYARLNERYAAMDEKLDNISKAVLGNGRTRDSLLARVERIEAAGDTRQKCGDRFWKVLGVLCALGAAVIAIFK